MFKIISSEEYTKLTVLVDYWKKRALEKEEVTFISFGEAKNLSKTKKLAEEIIKEINNEHKCDRNCFAEHVLSAIQKDYDKCNNSSNLIRHKFIEHWSDKLYDEYDFVSCICLVNDKLSVKYR